MRASGIAGLLGGWLLATLICPVLFAARPSDPAKPPFSIAYRSPAVIRGTPCSNTLAFTVSAVKNSLRAITFTNELRDAAGKTVWNGKAMRLGFEEELSLGVSVPMNLPALPPGRYTLVSQIPDAIRAPSPTLPTGPDPDLTLSGKPIAVLEEAPAVQLPPPLTVETILTIETAPAKPDEPFTLAIEAPALLPPGPIRIAATVTVSRADSPEVKPTLVAELTDDRERVFWREERPLAISDKPVAAVFSIAAPPLPAGQYFINARIRDSAGRFLGHPLPPLPAVLDASFNPSKSEPLPRGAVRKPLARRERFEFDRDLLWGIWDQGDPSREYSEGLQTAGINTGRRGNYYFRYRWFVDHDPLESTGMWTEDAFTNRAASRLDHYKRWMGPVENDPGFVVMDMYDEPNWDDKDDPAKSRLNKLMAWRVREKTPGVATITKWNEQMLTDCLGWDEVLREGFPQATGPNTIKLKWAFGSWVPELIRLRMAAVRELNPATQLTPGMGAGLMDNYYDSMHNRAYNKYPTVKILGLFTAGLPAYGTTPWSWLINLKPPFEQCSRITWASLAAAGRFFPIYCPGDGYGDRIADTTTGKLTPSGEMFKTVHDRIQPLAPVLLNTRNRIETGVLYYFPGWSGLENGFFEGLLACGVQPDCGTNMAGRKLLVLQGSSGAPDTNALIQAVRNGAGLVFSADIWSNAAPVLGLTPAPVHEGGQTNGWTGTLGKGWVVCLNTNLALNRPAGGAFMRAMLDRAGVRESFRFTDDTGAFHPDILGAVVETADRSQAYVIAVTESRADVQSRFYAADPAILAVRDLCGGQTLEWKQDARGRYVDVNLPRGVGTLLALLKDPADGRLQVTAPAAVAGGTTLSLAISRLAGNGTPLRAAHTIRVRLLDAGGNELPGLAARATGSAPVHLAIPVALSDPDGEWTGLAEDLTDGTTASFKISKKGTTSGPAAVPAMETRAPFTVTLDDTPALGGDLLLVTLKGRVTTSLAESPEVTIEPAVPSAFLLECPARLTLKPKQGAPASFAFHYRLTRAEAQALRGGRNQGVPVRLAAPGFETVETAWKIPVNPFQRAPHRIGTISGGTVSLRVDNFTDRDRDVTLACDPYPGWAGGIHSATRRVPAGTTGRLEWPVAWDDPAKLDPGLAWLPLRATVDGAAGDAGKLFLEQDLEQEWRVGILEMTPGEETAWNASAPAPLNKAEAVKRGWQKITTGTVLDWPALAARLYEKRKVPASILEAVTEVRTPVAKKVRIGFAGPTPPARILVNGEPVEADWAALAKTGGVRPQPVELRQGANTVAIEVLLPVPETAATSLVIQDATSGKRDRTLTIGAKP